MSMDPEIIYAKTPVGDEAVRERTRVVQRNLRMVLLQVNGSLSVRELIAKIGNQQLVESALRDLEAGGFIAVSANGVRREETPAAGDWFSVASEFSTFGPKSGITPPAADSKQAAFSAFGKPVLSAPPGPQTSKIEAGPPAFTEERVAPLAWGRWLAGTLGVVVLVLIGVILFYPYNNFRPGLEASLTQWFGAPVRIGGVGMNLLPRPALRLSDVSIGAGSESRLAVVSLEAPYALLGRKPYRVDRVVVSGGVLVADRLVNLRLFGARPEQLEEIFVRRIELEEVTFLLGDLTTPAFSGDILVRNDGSAEKAVLRSADGALRVQAAPSPQGVVLNIDGLGWRPADTALRFDSLQATGLLQKNRLLLQRLDTTFLGGILKGNWLIDWSAGMVMAGEASMARLDASRVSSVVLPALKLEGELSGPLRMRATGSGWHDMLKRIEANVDAEIGRGLWTGVDLGEVARRGPGAIVRSGATRFDSLAARLELAGGRVNARSIMLDAGLMTARGRLVVEADGQVDGSLTVQAQSSVNRIVVPVRLSGPLGDLTLLSGR